MGDLLARKRVDKELGPRSASEELSVEEKDRRGERYLGAMETGSHLKGGTGSCPCT